MCQCVCHHMYVLHTFAAVDFVCDHPYIRAISFVGSDRVGKYIYERGSANGKRVQSNMVGGDIATHVHIHTHTHTHTHVLTQTLSHTCKHTRTNTHSLTISSLFFTGCQKPWCHSSRCQQRAHHQPGKSAPPMGTILVLYPCFHGTRTPLLAGGCGLWSCRPAMYGSVHSHLCRQGQGMVARDCGESKEA